MGLSLSAAPERRLGAPLVALSLLVVGAVFLNASVGIKQVLLLITKLQKHCLTM